MVLCWAAPQPSPHAAHGLLVLSGGNGGAGLVRVHAGKWLIGSMSRGPALAESLPQLLAAENSDPPAPASARPVCQAVLAWIPGD